MGHPVITKLGEHFGNSGEALEEHFGIVGGTLGGYLGNTTLYMKFSIDFIIIPQA